jgi:glucose-6-phosphate dehydrogenase assembly protein OpcA
VRIEFVAALGDAGAIAPQALILAGWLASRLGWTSATLPARAEKEETHSILMEKKGGRIELEFKSVERPEMKPGRLASVELKMLSGAGASFVVQRSSDGLYLESRASLGDQMRGARVLPVRNRSEALLLGRELGIISHDVVYEEAVKTAAGMLKLMRDDAR